MTEAAPGISVSFVTPRLELLPFIDRIWIFESLIGFPTNDENIVAPNGCAKLVVAIENSLISRADGRVETSKENGVYFVGNRDSATLLTSPSLRTKFVTVEFRPNGAMPVLGVPLSATSNGLWEAEAVFGKWAREMRSSMASSEDIARKVDILQDYLVLALRENGSTHAVVDWCVSALRDTHGRLPIGELERQTGYSRRHLSYLFNSHVGFPPKVLAGVFRFQKYYRQIVAGRSFDLVKEELYADYFDQAHFSKEFKKMTGRAPGHYSRRIRNEFGRRILQG